MIVWSRGKNKEQLEEYEEREMDTSGMQIQILQYATSSCHDVSKQKNNRKDLLSTCKCHQLLLPLRHVQMLFRN